MATMNLKMGFQMPGSPPFANDGPVKASERKHLSGPGLRTFTAIADLWDLTISQRTRMLGHQPTSTYHDWIKAAQQHKDITLSYDVLMRISIVLGIYEALTILFQNETEGTRWLKRPNDALVFGCQQPIELLTSGRQDSMLTVRRFLDAARQGHYMAPLKNEAELMRQAGREVIGQ